MHIPDGFLDLNLAALFYLLSFAVLIYAFRKAEINPATLGVVAAAIFAAQMLNWPIPGGTSAHFVGGGLAGILLGPYAGSIAMSLVLIIQTLVFGDGGITALGANLWNMAIVNVFVGYYVYSIFRNRSEQLASFLAGWFGITLAATMAGVEIGLSSAFKYGVIEAASVMFIWHGVLGIIEGIITAAVISYISTRAEVKAQAPSKAALALIAVMIVLAPLFAYLAELVNYTEPLEVAAEKLGLNENSLWSGIFPDYTVPGINDYFGALITGAIGVALILAIGVALARANREKH